MSVKTALRNLNKKALETTQKGINWVQKDATNFERTVLVIGTIFMVRGAYKKFSINGKDVAALVTVELPEDSYGVAMRDIPFVQQVQSFTPEPYDYGLVERLYNLEVTDMDVWDMNQGMGMVFNIKDLIPGKLNYPLVVVPYEGLKKALDKLPDFPTNYAVEELLKENKLVIA